MAENKQTAPTANPNRPQPPKPPERKPTSNGDTAAAAPATAAAAAPTSTPAPAPVFTGTTEVTVESLKQALSQAQAQPVEARPPTELEIAIARVRELIENRDDKNPAPCAADKMTADQKRAMFQVIFDIEAKIQAAKDTIESEGVKRTYAVLSLITAYGGKMGKWSVNGVGLKARARGDSYFLVRPDQEEADVI